MDVSAGNRLILSSGQVPLDSADRVGANDARAQMVQVFENLRRGLASRGATFNDVIKMTDYVTDVRASLAVIREVRARYLSQQAPPASTLVKVGALFRPDIAIEVEVMAVVPR